ncbi:hypothetical protein ACSBR2_038085 [Camellia fascicularis]
MELKLDFLIEDCVYLVTQSNILQVTSTSVYHMRCFNDAAGRLQECALDAATKGNCYINSCLRMFCLVLMAFTWEVMETGAGQ